MLVYLLNIFLIIVWALVFCTGKRTFLKKALFVSICFLQCFLIAAYRFRVGYDYSMYASGFFSMKLQGFSDLSYEDWEIGFVLLNKVIGLFTSDVAVFMMVTSLISLAGPAYLIMRYSSNPFVSVFLYVNLYLFYLDMNYIRQAIAMSILCFAYEFLIKKKFWLFLIVTAVACLFHLTAAYMIFVYFVCSLKVSTSTHLLYLFGLLFYYILSDGMLNILLSKWHTEYSGSIFIESGVTFYYSIYPLMLCAGMVLLSYYVKEKSRTLNVLIQLTLLMGFWQIVMTKHALFERFSYYTMLFVVLAIPEAINAFSNEYKRRLELKVPSREYKSDEEAMLYKKKAERRISVKVSQTAGIITAAVLVTAFAYNMMGLIIPERGVHGVLPYQSSAGIDIPSIDSIFKS